MEHPDRGEFIFTDGDTVLTRRWVWRQSNHTMTELSTTFIEFNLDGLPPVTEREIKETGEDLADLVKQFCGGEFSQQVLSRENPKISIDN